MTLHILTKQKQKPHLVQHEYHKPDEMNQAGWPVLLTGFGCKVANVSALLVCHSGGQAIFGASNTQM